MGKEATAGASPGAAPGQGQPSPGAGQPGTAGSPPADEFEAAFAETGTEAGPPAGPTEKKEVPSSTPTDQPTATGGEAEADETKTKSAGAPTFDEEVAALFPEGKATPAESADIPLADLETPEKIQKAINPDGKVSETDQLKHLTTLVGKHSAEVHQARQLQQALDGWLVKDQSGQYTGFDFAKIVAAAPREVLDKLAGDNGLKLVPADFGEAQAGLARDYPLDLLEKHLPSSDPRFKDMSFEEKLEYLKSDPDRHLDFKLEKRERDRLAAGHKQDVARRGLAEIDTRLQELRAKDKTFDVLARRTAPDKADSYLDRANNDIPVEITGKSRADIAYKLAKLYRLTDPKVLKAWRDSIRQEADTELLNKRKLGAPVGGGGIDVARAGSGMLVGAAANDKEVWGD